MTRRKLQHAIHAKVIEQQGVVAVNVPAPVEVHLLAAVDDLPVGEIGMLGPGHGLQPGVAVEPQGHAPFFRELHQEGQQPGVAPGGEQQVGVMPLQQGAQVEQQGQGRVERKAVRVALVARQDRLRVCVCRVAVGLQRQAAQRRGSRVEIPGRVQRGDLLDVFLIS